MADLPPKQALATAESSNNVFAVTNLPSHGFTSAPKISIKLEDKNFLLWNQQVEGIITSFKLHRFLVNPEIPQQYVNETDRAAQKITDAYEQWLVQDQMLFTWILSTLSESVLPRVLNCKHSYQVWDKIHQHYYSHQKAKIRQLRSELKNTKKGERSISEYLMRIHTLANTLLAIGEQITDQDRIDVILDGLPEDYNPFVMMIYGKSDSSNLSDIEALLLVQEAQFAKHQQELSNATATANLAHATNGSHGNYPNSRGRGRNNNRGRGRFRGSSSAHSVASTSTGARPTCQLCGKYGHGAMEC